jgi:hypothetical protein
MKKQEAKQAKKANETQKKKAYVAPKLVSYGDFRRVTLVKGTVDKDGSGGGAVRTRISGGSNP